MDGVERADFNFSLSLLRVEHNLSDREIVAKIREMGYQAETRGTETSETAASQPLWMRNKKILLTVVSGMFWIAGLASFLLQARAYGISLMFAAMLAGGYYPFRASLASLRAGLVFEMNFLMTIAAAGALFLGEYIEAGTVVFLFSLGNTLEVYTMERTRRSIRSLMELAPRQATVLRAGQEEIVPVEELQLGDIIVVKPGERIPIDGVVVAGSSSVNQAAITGESLPVAKERGTEVYAGTINQEGSLQIEVTRLAGDTTLAKIIELVEEAQAKKAPTQRFTDVFARYYTPIVIALAVGIAVFPPLILDGVWRDWVYRGLALLLVSCPCALVISTPVSIVAAIGNAARNGVLIKGGAYLEQAGALRAIAFDKTGTVTTGSPAVADIYSSADYTPAEVLQLAASVERRSEHPLARAIVEEAEQQELQLIEAEHFVSITGRGVKAKLNGVNHYVGKPSFIEEELEVGLDDLKARIAELQQQGKTVMTVARKGELCGIIAVADRVRDESKGAIGALRRAGLKRIIMLTGDNAETAASIASELGIDEYYAELLPEDKVAAVRQILGEEGSVAMVGDGINDAPALAAATVGVAMGGAGTDTALETADIALMADDLSKLPFAINLSRKALRIIKQNIAFSLLVKLAAVLLVFPGWLSLWIAIAADTGAALIVILNGMRLLRVQPAKLG